MDLPAWTPALNPCRPGQDELDAYNSLADSDGDGLINIFEFCPVLSHLLVAGDQVSDSDGDAIGNAVRSRSRSWT